MFLTQKKSCLLLGVVGVPGNASSKQKKENTCAREAWCNLLCFCDKKLRSVLTGDFAVFVVPVVTTALVDRSLQSILYDWTYRRKYNACQK